MEISEHDARKKENFAIVFRLGLMGGTFDPPHIGHLRLAIEAFERLELNEVRLIPVNIPSHRSPPQASALDRTEMLAKVVGGPIQLDDCEIKRGGISLTIDTVKFMKNKFPSAKIFLIIGQDSLRSFKTWVCWEQLLKLTSLAIFAREGEYHSQKEHYLEELASYSHDNNIVFFDSPIIKIGSTEIRNKIKKGLNIDHLLPEKVARYINQKKLYMYE